tara:strand:- start:559 stop:876 length:318 start_codon:yes stop_codon:yes gene_type:complete
MEETKKEVFIMHNFIEDIVNEILDEIDEDTQYPTDLITEIVDGWVPVYNSGVIEFANELDGSDWSEVWLGDAPYEGENIIRQLQINIYNLLHTKVCSHEKIRKLI